MEHRGSHITSLLFILLLVTIAVGSKVHSHRLRTASQKQTICKGDTNGERIHHWPPAKRQLCGVGVYINRDKEIDLTYLPGIGPKRAAEIVRYRKIHGPFTAIDKLTQVKGIGPRTATQMRPWLEDLPQ